MTNTKPLNSQEELSLKEEENIIQFENDKESFVDEEIKVKEQKTHVIEIDVEELEAGKESYFYEHNRMMNKDLYLNHKSSLFHNILSDVQDNIFTYFLALVLCVLCVYKIHQVQETRNITSKYNQVVTDNENLHKKWLSLIATKQKLSEHAQIKKVAVERLGMMPPKTDAELVINLDR